MNSNCAIPKSPEATEGPIAGGNPGQSTQMLPALDPHDINIVLMGETGVGKSTFINGVVNYLKFSSLEEATACPNLHYLIPAKFTTTDDTFPKERVVALGHDENECQIRGQSATQSIRSYRFLMEDRNIRLIDTPGVGDTKGISEDEEKCDSVIDELAELKSVHAFCILLLPNCNRLSANFIYCIKQLLCRLGKSASENMVFAFTHSRGTFFRGGDGLVPIQEVLKSVKETSKVDIPFNENNIFYVDNEGFRFLLERKVANIKHAEDEERVYANSWRTSVDVSFKILSHVATLQPHPMQDTVSINEARRLILNLCYPLVLIAKNTAHNLISFAKQQEQLGIKNKAVQELKEVLHIEMTKLEVIELKHPRLICNHKDCSDMFDKKVCQERCYLKKVPKWWWWWWFSSSEIKDCKVMSKDRKNPICLRCGHSYLDHSQEYFATKYSISRESYRKADAHIKEEEEARDRIAIMIEDLAKKRMSLEKEKETIEMSMAKFVHFLGHNAMVVYNDAYHKYIQILIENERSLGPNQDHDLISSYNVLIRVHEENTRILDEQLRQARETDPIAQIITAQDVLDCVRELYKLESSGKFIRECYEKQQLVRQQIVLLHTEKEVDVRPQCVP